MASSGSKDRVIIKVREVKPDDAAEILEIYNPIIRDSAISFEVDPLSEAEMRDRIASYTAELPWLVSVHEASGKITGYAYASKHRARAAYRFNAEVSAYVHPDYQGQGLATRLYQAVFSILHDKGYRNAYAGVVQPNEASNHLHTKLGFREIGTYENTGFKFERWHSVRWYQLDLQNAGPGAADSNGF